jgi:hypothetical protein
VGGGVIALIENLVSPFFARVAKFQLPTFLLVASMLVQCVRHPWACTYALQPPWGWVESAR